MSAYFCVDGLRRKNVTPAFMSPGLTLPVATRAGDVWKNIGRCADPESCQNERSLERSQTCGFSREFMQMHPMIK